MFAPINAVCALDPGVIALLGSPPQRLYSFGEAAQDTVKPYAVWQTISGSPDNYLAGRPDIDGFTLQVDVFATCAKDARAVAKALRDAIEPCAYITRWGGESRDPVTKNYRYSFDVDWIVQR
ncbi:DUF3168 domain-containing protein [Pseudomonas lactis]|uniref:DUF3168 domain-containing protein n=1 Tax=Pseudomonas lactis TaxID=1615674 RepID=A0A7Y1M7R3_9PSED|nr:MULTISPECIES: DUF3168 domain-containing protein [Pseudomonas]NNA76764.1 DUF3168 domain-containing protein [Pseudomonas lactis]OOW00532.1 hypothetical protein MF4836_01060 [Pseudomonas sp. MF4836]